MKIQYSGKLLAVLGGSALALLPVANSLAEDRSCTDGSCRNPSAIFEELQRRFGDLGIMKDRTLSKAEAEPKTYLGVRLQPLSPDLAEAFGMKDNTGALIAEVLPQSPAEKAGLKQGDVITAIDGKDVADAAALQKAIAAHESGAKVEIAYLRGAEKKTAQAELAGPAADKSRSAKAADEKRDAAAPDDKTLGMKVADLDDRVRAQQNLPKTVSGAVITAVAEDSAADRAGLRVGDVVQEIDRQAVKDAAGAAALSKAAQDKDKVVVLVWSRGASRFAVLDRSA